MRQEQRESIGINSILIERQQGSDLMLIYCGGSFKR